MPVLDIPVKNAPSASSNALAGGIFSVGQSGNSLVLPLAPATPSVITGFGPLNGNGFALSGTGMIGQTYFLLTAFRRKPEGMEPVLREEGQGITLNP